jgi:hypothetical protein
VASPSRIHFAHRQQARLERAAHPASGGKAQRTRPSAQDPAHKPLKKKRKGNPYPDRISIGRALNCDIVLRVPFVSKIHAHIVSEADGSLSLRNHQPANSTFHNGRKLLPGATRQLSLGDSLGFGSMEVLLLDAERLYQLLTTEVR